ncbi:MAG TPA: succinate dehydrogenase, hydrophobic membrane anchor protein [Steroidobacteraceae bacterium]|nr:succinate dehydrogenase, hydrophobic membrane anchor protein [Steroidobacteraceae bacterium]
MSLKSPLGSVLGLGAAGGGAHHWWMQRLTAIALAPLGAWFVTALVMLPDLSYPTARGWLAAPWHAVPAGLLVLTATYHAWLGVRVVVEDYVHDRTHKLVTLVVLEFLHLAVGAGALYAVLKVALGGAA